MGTLVEALNGRGFPAAKTFGIPFLAMGATVLVFFSVLIVGQFRRNRIYLRRVRQDQKAREKVWKERAEKLIWLVLGIALGLIADRLRH